MDEPTLIALQDSIKRWEKIVANSGHSLESDLDCPLCQLFNQHVVPSARAGCHGCPVRESTGKGYCEDTPYYLWSDAQEDDEDRIEDSAKLELEFLKSLLPKPQKDPS